MTLEEYIHRLLTSTFSDSGMKKRRGGEKDGALSGRY